MPSSPSGDQYLISHGPWQADITGVGATLRSLSHEGRPLIDGFSSAERASDGRGQVLVPWPNRITGGAYTFGGREVQAPLTEPARGTAIHGLVRWLDWSLMDRATDLVSLGCTVYPQPGYEWQLDVRVTYALDSAGLTVVMETINGDETELPLGVGCHPYLTIGEELVDDLTLQLPATHRLDVASDGTQEVVPVSGTDYDFTTQRRVGSAVLDTAFVDFRRDDDGYARAYLTDPGGKPGVQLWVDEAFKWLMVYTADGVGRAEGRRRAIAIEPMTCPPEAFRTGTDVVTVPPGGTWRGRWGLGLAR